MSRESKLEFVTIGSQATVDKLRGGRQSTRPGGSSFPGGTGRAGIRPLSRITARRAGTKR